MEEMLTKTGKFFTKFPHINQYRQIVSFLKCSFLYVGKDENDNPIYDDSIELPTITFYGTTKIHGTNASVCERNDVRWIQSRNNIITSQNDNAGFAAFVENNPESFTNIFNKIYEKFGKEENKRYMIFW